MKCPHCLVEFHDDPHGIYLGRDVEGDRAIVRRGCPACKKFILHLQTGSNPLYGGGGSSFVRLQTIISERLVHPKGAARQPCPAEVPKQFRGDYLEGCVVLPDSPKAAAALGRRSLQTLLREVANVKPGNLADEIQQVLDTGKLPSDLNDSIDAVRNIGNFAAHPLKSQRSREIFDVEPGEAEWTLDVLEDLFDYYFVGPAKRQKKIAALNEKLAAAGKPAMK